jgi:hypothetical protein
MENILSLKSPIGQPPDHLRTECKRFWWYISAAAGSNLVPEDREDMLEICEHYAKALEAVYRINQDPAAYLEQARHTRNAQRAIARLGRRKVLRYD